jgi:YD repeat-containing protein
MRGTVLTETGGRATLRWKNGSVWTFGTPMAGVAWLTTQADRYGNAVSLTRDSLQNLTTISDSTGRQLLVTVDPNNRITAITDPLGRTVQYGYDTNGHLLTVTDPAGGITRYTYVIRDVAMLCTL